MRLFHRAKLRLQEQMQNQIRPDDTKRLQESIIALSSLHSLWYRETGGFENNNYRIDGIGLYVGGMRSHWSEAEFIESDISIDQIIRKIGGHEYAFKTRMLRADTQNFIGTTYSDGTILMREDMFEQNKFIDHYPISKSIGAEDKWDQLFEHELAHRGFNRHFGSIELTQIFGSALAVPFSKALEIEQSINEIYAYSKSALVGATEFAYGLVIDIITGGSSINANAIKMVYAKAGCDTDIFSNYRNFADEIIRLTNLAAEQIHKHTPEIEKIHNTYGFGAKTGIEKHRKAFEKVTDMMQDQKDKIVDDAIKMMETFSTPEMQILQEEMREQIDRVSTASRKMIEIFDKI